MSRARSSRPPAGARVRRLVLVPSLGCLVPAVLASFDAIEWAEPCFAGAVALSACNTLSRLPRGRPGEKPG